MTALALQAAGVEHAFGETVALRNVSLDVPRGTVAALLGPNGAGKSTLVDCFCTVLRPDAGHLEIGGVDLMRRPQQARRRIGVVFQEPTLDTRLSVRANLAVHCAAWGVPRAARQAAIAEALEVAGLAHRADAPAASLSTGMRRRLEIARALLHGPEVLILDEPTTGLDAASRLALWDHVTGLAARRDLTVLCTTHYTHEVEAADRVHVIAEGRIVAEGSPDELRARFGHGVLRLRPRDLAARRAVEAAHPDASWSDGMATIRPSPPDTVDALFHRWADAARDISIERASLESAVLALTEKGT
ncbi:ABC transporter ATP-binding protein [Salipiger sp. IMCC34102]|uniref:ABC transporter ATP-binding protein n=1 Tax=Salipiger sp. IMCC34102 TaxID=2510647 RepID=UPI0013ECF213|nr:ABC transporter ATP-binding protein [Salipiger sp. IMCC34102]